MNKNEKITQKKAQGYAGHRTDTSINLTKSTLGEDTDEN